MEEPHIYGEGLWENGACRIIFSAPVVERIYKLVFSIGSLTGEKINHVPTPIPGVTVEIDAGISIEIGQQQFHQAHSIVSGFDIMAFSSPLNLLSDGSSIDQISTSLEELFSRVNEEALPIILNSTKITLFIDIEVEGEEVVGAGLKTGICFKRGNCSIIDAMAWMYDNFQVFFENAVADIDSKLNGNPSLPPKAYHAMPEGLSEQVFLFIKLHAGAEAEGASAFKIFYVSVNIAALMSLCGKECGKSSIEFGVLTRLSTPGLLKLISKNYLLKGRIEEV